MASWRPDTGLVCAPPVAACPEGFWSEVECAFLNTYQARWQYAADTLGLGFAQGKIMLWRRDVLENAGGIAALGRDLAEDAAATKIVRSAGLRVRLAEPSFFQPIGLRTIGQVLARQTRWAQLRRLSFPRLYAPEILSSSMLPMLTVAAAATLLGGAAWLAAAGVLGIWIATEYALARIAGWHFGWLSPAAILLRDLLIPWVWIKGWMAATYEWHGNRVVVAPTAHQQGRMAGA
jgi:ceramide glucosyltransferase